MPKRIISDITWKSKKVRNIQPPEFRAEYAWIMSAVEDNGVFEYDPEPLWADAYALARPGWTPERVKELLDELIRVGLLIRYEAQGKTWCYLVGSDKPGHLPAPSMRNSKFPLPSSYDKPSQSLGKSYDEPSLPLASPTESFLGSGIGIGSGIGSGSGPGTGEGESLALATLHSMATLQKNTKQKNTERESVEKDDNNNSISLAEYLYNCMDKLNPDAILNAPAKWKQYWAGDIGKLLSTYNAGQVSEIIKESQLNPTFRKYVVRGKGLADMAESIWTHLVEHGGYPNEPGDFDEDVEESDDTDLKLSRLNGWPTVSPVNASPYTSRCTTHDSGPVWFAIPSLHRTCTCYSLPVSRRTSVLKIPFRVFSSITRCTCTADHSPPRGVGISRALSPAAILRRQVAPAT
jgi:hypothetical protein